MTRVNRSGWTAYALAVLIVALDQAAKYWVVNVLRLQDIDTVAVAGPLHLTWVMNPGVSFGFLRADHDVARWGLVVFSLVVAVMIAWWARRAHRGLQVLGYGLIAGGAVGNAIDRTRLGYVVDFIDVQRLGFFPWVFNIADSAITVGVIALLLDSLRREQAGKGAEPVDSAPRD
ncbi:MAG TPA: signal peptidase II [Phenylobacterium sp.]|jgi:signal peptidase II|nr:signal peptidase II [Phenylobacterium sp.]